MLLYADVLPNSYLTLQQILIQKITGTELDAAYAVYNECIYFTASIQLVIDNYKYFETVRLNGGLSNLDSFLDFEIIGSVVIIPRKTSIKIDFKVKIVEIHNYHESIFIDESLFYQSCFQVFIDKTSVVEQTGNSAVAHVITGADTLNVLFMLHMYNFVIIKSPSSRHC